MDHLSYQPVHFVYLSDFMINFILQKTTLSSKVLKRHVLTNISFELDTNKLFLIMLPLNGYFYFYQLYMWGSFRLYNLSFVIIGCYSKIKNEYASLFINMYYYIVDVIKWFYRCPIPFMVINVAGGWCNCIINLCLFSCERYTCFDQIFLVNAIYSNISSSNITHVFIGNGGFRFILDG